MIVVGLILILIVLLIVLALPQGKRAQGRDDTALLDWADQAGHHSARYKSIRAELRAERTKS